MRVHWHRRDLRTTDNRGLPQAAEAGSVVPVFVFDPTILEHASPVRVTGMLGALEALRGRYREHDSDLLVRRGEPSAVLPELEAAAPEQIHGWHELSPDEQVGIAPDYPAPIVDHADRREQTIEMFERARSS